MHYFHVGREGANGLRAGDWFAHQTVGERSGWFLLSFADK
jgi:hypothetical protein